MSAFWSMFWFKPFQNFLRKIAIFKKFDHWSEIMSLSAGRPISQGVCPPLPDGIYCCSGSERDRTCEQERKEQVPRGKASACVQTIIASK
jgi:hypothetical protein